MFLFSGFICASEGLVKRRILEERVELPEKSHLRLSEPEKLVALLGVVDQLLFDVAHLVTPESQLHDAFLGIHGENATGNEGVLVAAIEEGLGLVTINLESTNVVVRDMDLSAEVTGISGESLAEREHGRG